VTTPRRRPGRPRGAQQDPAARRAALLDAAELAIAEHGVLVSMEQIAERAGVSKATLYDNFDGKAGLSDAILERYGARLLGAFAENLGAPQSARQVVRNGIETFVDLIETDPELYRFVVRNSDGDALLAEITSPIGALLRSVLEADGDEGADALAHATLGAIVTATDWWCRHRDLDHARFVDLLDGFVWSALAGSGIPASDAPVDLAAVAEAIATAQALHHS
jgi:AcrR family transcriptional regulator